MGVCLGMQALFEKSYEGGTYDCLGFLPGDIVPFHTKLKVPHMGWNELEFRQGHWLQKGLRLSAAKTMSWASSSIRKRAAASANSFSGTSSITS